MSVKLSYAPLLLNVYLCDYDEFLDTVRSTALPSNGNTETIFDTHNGLVCYTVLGVWSRRALIAVDAALFCERTKFDT